MSTRTDSNPHDLSGRSALVTGANMGIGAATAVSLARRGAAVLVAYLSMNDPEDDSTFPPAYRSARSRDGSQVVEAIRREGGRAEALEADLSDERAPSRLFEHAERELGPVEILVLNATGWQCPDSFSGGREDQVGRPLRPVTTGVFDAQLAVDARASALLIAEFARRHALCRLCDGVRPSGTEQMQVAINFGCRPLDPGQRMNHRQRHALLTDGEEAPRLHAFNTENLTNFQGGSGWLLVGVGSQKGTPIPKLDEKNQLIGYWAGDSFAMQPGIAQISEANVGVRTDNVAGGESDRYLSKLDEDYLKSLAKEVGGFYVRGDSLQSILAAMKQQKPARRDIAPFVLDWVLAALAGLILISAYLPRHPIKQLRASLDALKQRRRKSQLPSGAEA